MTMNNVDNYSDYNEIDTNQTPTPETTTKREETPKQTMEPITDEDETTITTEENETTTTNKASQPRRTKTTPRHLQVYILRILIIGEFKCLEVGRNVVN